ncbi:MAG TPA: hypothetical protein VKB54_01795 [Solirubrobacteraceae bacterium]|nr:hypothetical protein [Solirubrobacteraceae bacterium]
MKFLRNTPREPREQRLRGSLDGPSRTITVEPVETPTPAPPPEVRPEPSREPARPASPTTPSTPTR